MSNLANINLTGVWLFLQDISQYIDDYTSCFTVLSKEYPGWFIHFKNGFCKTVEN